MSLALITWASSWIWKAFAQQLAKQGNDVFLIARRKEKLDKLSNRLENEYGIQAHVLALDLTGQNAVELIMQSVNELNLEVKMLINNAWFGGLGKFQDRSIAKDLAMIDLNIKAVVSLTHALLPMIIKNQWKILNVWSTAGFMPWPLQATYFATKAFVNSWSQALAQELVPTWVTVTVLCPWATASEFAQSADASDSNLFKWELETTESVARKGLEGIKAWKRVIITDWKLNLMIHWLLPLLPSRLVTKIVEKMHS